MKQKNTNKTLVAVVVVLLCVGLAPSIAAAGETPNCHYTAYTADYVSRHFSLLKDNSTLVGTSLIVEQPSTCSMSLMLDGGISFDFSGSGAFDIPLYTSTISITQDNLTSHYSNLTIFPAGSVLYSPLIEDTIFSEKSNSEIWWGEILAHIVTFTLLFFLSTTVVYRVARNKVDNSIEVVI